MSGRRSAVGDVQREVRETTSPTSGSFLGLSPAGVGDRRQRARFDRRLARSLGQLMAHLLVVDGGGLAQLSVRFDGVSSRRDCALERS
jgi:hypothetical protein